MNVAVVVALWVAAVVVVGGREMFAMEMGKSYSPPSPRAGC